MTQEDKELLIKDLSTRLPYKVKVEAKGLLKTFADEYDYKDSINAYVLNGLNLRDYFKTYSIDCMEKVPLFNRKGVCNIKPYLFPMSSMTEEQYNEVWNCMAADNQETLKKALSGQKAANPYCNVMDFYNKNHFDYRGLIEKGLALDATGLNLY